MLFYVPVLIEKLPVAFPSAMVTTSIAQKVILISD